MNLSLSRRSFALGLVWAVLMLAFAWRLPPRGSWTIDDSVKRIAAVQGQGVWAETLKDGPVRSAFDDPQAFTPLNPPFALHHDHVLAFGFSPWTRALFKIIHTGGDIAWRLVPVFISIIVWLAFELAGIPWAFLFLPLTFYGLVPWEHALSWLLLLPAVMFVSRQSSLTVPGNQTSLSGFIFGVLLAAAMALRPETVEFFVVCFIFLLHRKHIRLSLMFASGTLLGLAALWMWHVATSAEPALIQIGLNALGEKTGLAAWFMQRFQAAYGLLLSADSSAVVSGGILLLLAGGTLAVWLSERRQKKSLLICGTILLLSAVAVFQFRLWSSPLPPLKLLQGGGLFIALPWVLLLLLPPFRGRPLFWLAVAAMFLTILVTPVWSGVHWGPRILLFAVPLLLFDLHASGRLRGSFFMILLVATLVQTVGSAALVYARAGEVSDRVRLTEPVLGKVVICPTMSQCADLAPLWPGREFFAAANARELRQALLEMRSLKVDTVWVHAAARDPLVNEAFPGGKPLVLTRATHVQARSLYTTAWRIYEFAVNAQDTLWAQVLETEAGSLLAEGKVSRALQWQRDAVQITPQSAARHHNLALILWQHGENTAAHAEAETALTLDSSLVKSHRLLAILDSLNAVGGANSPRP